MYLPVQSLMLEPALALAPAPVPALEPGRGRSHPCRNPYRHFRCLGLWLLVLLAPIHAGAQTSSSELAVAETLLFETDHLARVEPPAVLVYEFHKVSNVEPGFSDKVQLDVAGSKGKVSATLHFLSGKNRHDLPALQEAHGNPVLLGFLERDIAEMKRLTGGSTAYFRKRLRMALAESAQVSPQSIAYRGKTLPAQAVRIQPYLDDPLHARFEQYVNKTYTFIVSDQVPGGIYQLRSSLANRARQQPGTTVAGSGEGGIAPGRTATTPVMEAKASKDVAANEALAKNKVAQDLAAKDGAVAQRAVEDRTAAATLAPAARMPAPAAQTTAPTTRKPAPTTKTPAPTTGAGAGTFPEIDETLTLLSVAQRQPDSKSEAERKR